MNLSLEAISLITVFDISWSFLESSSLLKNSEAFFTDCRVTSTIFFLSPRKTFSASGRRRAPWHTGQGSSVQKCFVPRPLHAGHAPYGELKEKSRGSTSGKENPSYGHMNLLDMIRLLTPSLGGGSGSSTFTSPSASPRARSTASDRRSIADLLSRPNSDMSISSTKASISCFL